MNIIDLVMELKRQSDIAREMGLDPKDVCVMIPVKDEVRVWEEVEYAGLIRSEEGIWDLYLNEVPHFRGE